MTTFAFFLTGEGNAYAYRAPALTAMYNFCLVTAKKDFLLENVEAFEEYFKGWEERHLTKNGLYWSIDDREGTEFTNDLLQKSCDHKSLFENMLDKYGIIYHRIRVATPRHNGKVERQHRIDESRFYKKMRMYCLEDGRKQLERYNTRSNNIPKICLNFRSTNEVLADYLAIM